MRFFALTLWVGLAGCSPDLGVAGFGWEADPKSLDEDADGFTADVDCADLDATVNPDATEVCNATDDDCDGAVDESACGCDASDYGDRTRLFCTAATDWADAQTECAAMGYHLADLDDAGDDAAVFAETQAVAAGNWWIGLQDRDIESTFSWDGGSDSPYTNWRSGEPNDFGADEDCTWYASAGSGAWNDKSCAASAYYVCQTGCLTRSRYADADGDGYGDAGTPGRVCDGESGWVESDSDCDDTDAVLNPDTVWYGDADGDGFAGDVWSVASCISPTGFSAVATDCDDGDAAAYPGGTEVPADGVDQDCDGADGCTWFADTDGDGWGDAAATTEDCAGAPVDFVATAGDCDDTESASFPGGPEVPYDGIDGDCSGGSDDDADGDGMEGNGGTDCDDADAAVHPGALEGCDAVDNDCDGAIDLGADCPGEVLAYDDHAYVRVTTASTWADAQTTCADIGYHLVDVRDAAEEAWIWTEAEAADPDSSWWHGANDREVEGTFAWDGGSPSVFSDWRAGEPNDFGGSEDCAAFADDGAGAWNDRDCVSVYPFLCEAGCERLDAYADADGDGWGDAAFGVDACEVPGGYVQNALDCDDATASVNPAAVEVCDAVDNDCDGLTDDADPGVDPTTFGVWFADRDGDGDGIPSETVLACSPPPGWAATATDCDDEDPSVYAGAPDPLDGLDADCGGGDEAWDSDGDGVWDTVERRLGLDPEAADSDGDGLSDGEEADEDGDLPDHDGDGIPDALDDDDDGDTVPTADEVGPDGAIDTDGDGVPDHLDLDSDADGSADSTEAGRDSDHDGVPNARETDDDGDGRLSADEDAEATDPDGDGVPNSLDQDSDGDGCPDSAEGEEAWLNAEMDCPEDTGTEGDPGLPPPPTEDTPECGCGQSGAGAAALGLAYALRRRGVVQGAPVSAIPAGDSIRARTRS